jgi:hypothetical protein
MSRNLPCREAPVIGWPAAAVIGGSKVFSALIAETSMRSTVCP